MVGDRWSSKFGFLLATIGAAVGLGNVWRFSSVVGTNGGGGYLIPYLIAAFCLALPMLILELSIGRTLRMDVISAFKNVNVSYAPLGWIVVISVLIILSYYLVLTGWVFGFLVSWFIGTKTTFSIFTSGWLPLGYFLVVTIIAGIIVSSGVRGGIERMSKVVMPTVFLLLIGLAVYAITFSGWGEAVAFLFSPDFSVLSNISVWSAAFGQVFFSLSVGQGIMLTYGSYIDENTDIFKSSLLITVSDILAALLAGLVIFPIVFSFGLQPTLGTELAFTTLPSAFDVMPAGQIVAISFFGLLFFAALSSSVALLEVGVASMTNTTRLDRVSSTIVLTFIVFLAGIPSVLSYTSIGLSVWGRPFLDIVDESIGTYALPISGIIIVVVFVWGTDLEKVKKELGRLYPMVKYFIPLILTFVIIAKLLGFSLTAWRLLVNIKPNNVFEKILIVIIFLLITLAVIFRLKQPKK